MLVSGIVIIPLLLAVAVTVMTAFHIFKRKTLAQSICIQEGVKIQDELRDTLRDLLKMNRQATTLRAQRDAADAGLKAALSSGYPPAIAAATAVWNAVYAAQIVFRARQEALLFKADRQRREGKNRLRGRLDTRYIKGFSARQYYPRGLAVYPEQPLSLTPDYVPVPGFKYFQQQRYSYQVDLYPGEVKTADRQTKNYLNQVKVQRTECSVSLDSEEENWKIQIVAASAQSKSWSF